MLWKRLWLYSQISYYFRFHNLTGSGTLSCIWNQVLNILDFTHNRNEIIFEFLCLRTLCYLQYLNFWQKMKKSLKSDKNFLKLLFLKLSDNFKVGRRLKYRYPVNRIIWILRVSYNHMIIVAQNIKKIATVSSSKLHE